mmetsp:Transcript_25937/g.39251  ORF Transcript_25937/g.39251 Transcript_25937/m.39251 type:complete len:675 (+) Transcript_25937:92-2116(+)
MLQKQYCSIFLQCTFVLFSLITNQGIAWSQTQAGTKRTKTTALSEQKIPKTGWGHNLPGKDSSFWEDNKRGKEGTLQDPRQQQQKEEPRTGWLHNTEPKKHQDEMEKKSGASAAQLRLEEAKLLKDRNHRLISPPYFHSCGRNQFVVTEHKLSVPVYRHDHNEEGERIDIYFSIVEIKKEKDDDIWKFLQEEQDSNSRAQYYVNRMNLQNADGLMLYLQGGPGFGAPTPVSGIGLSESGSWAGKALAGNYYDKIVLMDQRGVGKSTPITKQWLERKFPDLFMLDSSATTNSLEDDTSKIVADDYEKVQQAANIASNYMAQFRADNIVLDAEEIKNSLLIGNDSEEKPYGCALGQSFGGFCLMTYLSQIKRPPKVCLFTGGIAPMLTPVYDVYHSLWHRVKDRNLQYYDMFPGDIYVVKKIVNTLLNYGPVKLPSGSNLTARRFLQSGLALGGSPSTFARLHHLFNSAFLDDNDHPPVFTRSFLKAIDSEHSFDDHPIYFLLHESIYADGPKNNCPTKWMAHNNFESMIQTPSEFDYKLTCSLKSDQRPTLFFGEMVFPWQAEGDYAECSGIGMRCLANALATKDDWGPLYDGQQIRVALDDNGICRAAAAVYYDDLYVDFDASMKVVKGRGTAPLEKCKVWVTNEFQHSGLRDDGAKIFAKLHGMATGKIRVPS